TSTTVFFQPDPTIVPKIESNPEPLRERLEIISYIHKGVRVTYEDEVNKRNLIYQHAGGVVDFLGKILTDRNAKASHPQPFVLCKDNGQRLELALQWTESTDEHVKSYVNGIPT